MEVTRAYKFRIYPDAKRQSEIDYRLILAQQFYNKILEKSIAFYKDGKAKVSMAQFNRFVKEILQENKDFMLLYSQTRCEIEYRLFKAYSNFFRRCKEGKGKKGFPRFRSRNRYKSLTYPQDNGSFGIERIKKKDRLRVSRIGTMKIELHRKIEGTIKTLSIKREAGNYYAIFTTVKEINPPKIKDTKPVGIDMGLNSFIAISDGTKIEKPKFVKRRAKRIAHWQRVVARRTRWEGNRLAREQSKNRDKAKLRLQREWEHATNQSNDFAHKLTDKLINSGYTSFAVEKLNIQNMAKNHNLAQAIYNASWNKFFQMLSYKAESAGMGVNPVDPKNTTQECSRCHNIKEGKDRLTLKDRVYRCFVCGLELDRDINASINILAKGREGHSRTNASGDATSAIHQESQIASMNQEHTLQPMAAGEAHML